MWMMMDNDSVELKVAADPLMGRKLRPLMPRPIYSTSSCCCIRNPNILSSWNHSTSDHKREAPLVSTRWNPTPEQLQALEEMYRRGIRTPTAEQIQQIAAKLRRFGKIEGKNVFYWFQNHKARERQKKRRQLDQLLAAKNTPGVSRRCFEIEHERKKVVPIPSNCSTPSEDSASMHGAVIAAECGWNHKELEVAITTATAAGNELDLDLELELKARKASGQENTKPYENQTTLELFPSPTPPPPQQLPHTFTPTHTFIEFLPIKN